jgi:chemotaxis response regulator CheB
MKGSVARMKSVSRAASPVRQAELFPIVGIGASAGGLEAFSELLRALPQKTGMAFVLVQHLDPTHSSDLREILGRITKIPVQQVTDGVAVRPDTVYVIPPNTSMAMKNGILRLAARVLTRGQHMPIDHFLRSLAEDRGNRAISVILSGTASDRPKARALLRQLAESPLLRMKNQPSTLVCRTVRSRPGAWTSFCPPLGSQRN